MSKRISDPHVKELQKQKRNLEKNLKSFKEQMEYGSWLSDPSINKYIIDWEQQIAEIDQKINNILYS